MLHRKLWNMVVLVGPTKGIMKDVYEKNIVSFINDRKGH